MLHISKYILYLFKYIPDLFLYALADILFILLYPIIGYRKKIVYENVKNSFPKLKPQRINQIVTDSYRNFVDVMLESLRLYSLSDLQLKRRVKLLNPEVLDKLYASNKGAILIGGHYNNWEWAALAISARAKQNTYSVYKPLSNNFIDRLMHTARSRFGGHIIPMSQFPKTVLQNKGQSTINIILADQSPHKDKVDFYCDFLNQDTPVFLGPEKLMKAANLALYFLDVQRIKRGYYQLKIVPLTNEVGDVEGTATKLHVAYLEKMITKKPENWLWSHRRWKHSRKN